MKKLTKNNRAQMSIEYTFITICVLAALLSTQVYLRRALSGGIRQSADRIGEQYDPRHTSGFLTHTFDREIISEVDSHHKVVLTDVEIGGITRDEVVGYATHTNETVNRDTVTRSGVEVVGPLPESIWE